MTEVRPTQNVIRRDARYKICDCIRQIQTEWKGALKATQSMGKGLHKLFSAVVKEILQELTPLISFLPQQSFLVLK